MVGSNTASARLLSGPVTESGEGSAVRRLCTIGYEGANLDDFLSALKNAKISILVDVREIPISRRKGFSKSALKTHLERAGIEYRHEKQLGSPKAIRHRLRRDWDYKRFFKDFDRHLSQQQGLLERLPSELKGNVVFMCFEKEAHDCHRSRVVDALADILGRKPIHLSVVANDGQQTHQVPHSDLGESLSPA